MALRNIILLSSNVAKSVSFYNKAIGLSIVHQSESLAELQNSRVGGVPIIIKESYTMSELTCGYFPIMSFEVADMDTTITSAMTMGAQLDGPILYPTQGKFASIRTPDGNMIGLFEPSNINLNASMRQ